MFSIQRKEESPFWERNCSLGALPFLELCHVKNAGPNSRRSEQPKPIQNPRELWYSSLQAPGQMYPRDCPCWTREHFWNGAFKNFAPVGGKSWKFSRGFWYSFPSDMPACYCPPTPRLMPKTRFSLRASSLAWKTRWKRALKLRGTALLLACLAGWRRVWPNMHAFGL